VKLETSDLAIQNTGDTNEKDAKLGQWVGKVSRDLLLKFLDLLHLSGTVAARNFKFIMRIDNKGH